MTKLSVTLAVLCLLNKADARRLKKNDAYDGDPDTVSATDYLKDEKRFVQTSGDRFDQSFEEEAVKANMVKNFNQFDGLNHYGKNAYDSTGQLVGGVNFT